MAAMTDADWMRRAALAAGSFRATTQGAPRSRHRVYVVLLRNAARSDPRGLYVGQTSLDPDMRFDQHMAGYKASRAVRRFGIRLLPDMVAHLNPLAGWESLDLEAALADAFRAVGIAWVEGGH